MIQHFVLHPTRRPSNVKSLPLRVVDLCKECAETLTRPAGDEVTEVIAPQPESKPVAIVNGEGKTSVPRTRNRPDRCPSRHPHSKTRCIWDRGHANTLPHQAANSQKWY
jgi:hypothetical protein